MPDEYLKGILARSTVVDQPAPDEAEPTAPIGETNAEAFKRLGKARVTVALKRIQLIGNLANRSTYEYTDEQVAKMFAVLQAELDNAAMKFIPKERDKPAFDFDE